MLRSEFSLLTRVTAAISDDWLFYAKLLFPPSFPLVMSQHSPFSLKADPVFFYQLLDICLIFAFVSQRVLFLFPNDTFSTSPLARRSGGWINLLLCQVKSHLATTCSRPRWRPADCSAATGLETRPFPEPSQVLRRYPPVSGTGLESYAD